MRKFRFAQIIVCTLAVAVSCAAQEHLPQHNWDYGDTRGPSHWGELKPEFATCKNGHHQSPSTSATRRRQPCLRSTSNIGLLHSTSSITAIHHGQLRPGSFISVGDKKYALKQFHFHRPSEENINGKAYEMSVHLVHEDEDGNLGVVAVLLRTGDDNPLVHELWNHLPKEKEREEKLDRVQINAGELLPADRDYYTYPGGLTTPPCSENVTWFVLKHAVTVSTKQIVEFSKLYRHNARPTQPLYDRVVLESQ